jgi:uncharacterized protein (DUF1697 family)
VPQYVAFLRAINVGGRVVKMEVLRAHCADLGLANVRTFIASGNVIFDSPRKPAALEQLIEKHLNAALGYEVETFIRSLAELKLVDVDVEKRFAGDLKAGSKVYVGFLRELPSAAQCREVEAFSNDIDVLSFGTRELYWLCHKSIAETTVGPSLGRALGGPMTTRNITSLRKLIATFK